MKKPVVVIIGGSQEETFKKIGEKMNCEVLFHNGKARGGGTEKVLKPLINKADCTVILYGACGHITMDIVKSLSKKQGKSFVCHKGRGASGAIGAALQKLETSSAA